MIIPEAGVLKKRNEFTVEIIERDVQAADRKAFTPDDALFMLEWPVLKFAAGIMPENWWADFAMWLERMTVRLGRPSPATLAPAIRQALGLDSLEEAEAIAWRTAAGRIEHHIQVMKVMSAGGWGPEMRLEGEEHLKAALARGKGAITWVAHFCFNTQVTKMALKAGGYRVSHLSRPETRILEVAVWRPLSQSVALGCRAQVSRQAHYHQPRRPRRFAARSASRAGGQPHRVDHGGGLGGPPRGPWTAARWPLSPCDRRARPSAAHRRSTPASVHHPHRWQHGLPSEDRRAACGGVRRQA